MDSFERGLEEDMAQRFDEGFALGKEEAARRCEWLAMEMSRALNEEAVTQIRTGRLQEASRTEMKADQCEKVAKVIRLEFGLKPTADCTVLEHSEIRSES